MPSKMLKTTSHSRPARTPRPMVQLSAQIAPWLFIGGLLLTQSNTLTWAPPVLFGASSIFPLLTLPVEFNASKLYAPVHFTASSRTKRKFKA